MLGASRRQASCRSVREGDDCGWVDYLQWTGDTGSSGWKKATYVYDPAGRRITKKLDGVTQTKYLYNGAHCIAEYDGNDTLVRKFIHGPCVDEPICMIDVEDSNAVYYYHYDGLGSVVALSDSAGDTVQLYEYTVYGQVAAEDPNHPNPFLFTARRFDTETGLYYYRARYYNPYIGRFLQTDPISYDGGTDLYHYCENNPLNLVDPLGERAWWANAVDAIGSSAGWILEHVGPYAEGASDIGGGMLAVGASIGLAEGGHGMGALAAFDTGVMMMAMGAAKIIGTATGNETYADLPSTVPGIAAYVFFGEEAGLFVNGAECIGLGLMGGEIPTVARMEDALSRLAGIMDGVKKIVESFHEDSEDSHGTSCEHGADLSGVADGSRHTVSKGECPNNIHDAADMCPVCGNCPCYCNYRWTWGMCTVLPR